MNFQVIIQPEAEDEIDDAFHYLDSIRTGLGFDFLALLSEVIGRLEDNPFQYQKILGEKRRAVIQKFKYSVIYLINNDEVFILAVIHGSRHPRKWKTR
ncbi:MAG: type II toxin-antitoxin system RelE/ParE family toxin [Bacteroidota bacterium]